VLAIRLTEEEEDKLRRFQERLSTSRLARNCFDNLKTLSSVLQAASPGRVTAFPPKGERTDARTPCGTVS